ncbi:AAEL006842-PA [Aedes aegypti]|uniref:AAEL006842-PA n=1 Tax=Aedes aegypti TaxID=7159 RepID=Q174M3_AEDAE|nr:AAEL006842-PA [Aedes aegypti]
MLNAYSESQSDLENEQNFGAKQKPRPSVNRQCPDRRSSLVKRSVSAKSNRRPSINSVYNEGQFSESCSMRKKPNKSVGSVSSTSGTTMDSSGSSCSDGDTSSSYGEPNLPYPGFAEYSLKYLSQDTKPRIWCLQLITNPYPFQKFKLIPICGL